MRVLGRHHGHGWKGLEEQRLEKKMKMKGGMEREGQEVGLREIMMYLLQTMGTAAVV